MSEEEMYQSLYEGYEEGTPEVELGRRFERQLIVNWLRDLPHRLGSNWANAIEQGDHLT